MLRMLKALGLFALVLSTWTGAFADSGGFSGSGWAGGSPSQKVLLNTFARARSAGFVAEGRGARVVYIFFDPNCPYCDVLYAELRRFVGAKSPYQFRWVPVGILDPSSLGKAAAILGAGDPVKAFHENEAKFNRRTDSGGIEEDLPSARQEAQLRGNEALLKQLGVMVVPAMLFRDAQGRAQVIHGAPAPGDVASILETVR
ncbi:MAG: thioredoxin fold domain-containing protein [Betaproteobacteria bacterium]|nr:thioredoxin fold domain-containing protein [Betaproteobacteria bacterium]